MTTTNTASNYINKINEAFPTAGQDNSTAGFRNNFKNIKTALNYTDLDIYNLKLSSVKANSTNNFNDNKIKQAAFQDCATVIYDATETIEYGDVDIDYRNGSYQKIKVSGGYHTIRINYWPPAMQAGRLLLSIAPESLEGATIDFAATNLINLSTDLFPVAFTGSYPQFFELWSDDSGSTVYVNSLGGNPTPTIQQFLELATATSAVQNIILGQTNTILTSTNSATTYATVIKADGKSGNVALLPNKLVITSKFKLTTSPGVLTTTTFGVSTTTGIMVGALVNFPGSTSTSPFSVVSFTTDTVTLTPAFEVNAFSVGDPITFVNPEFNYQPRLAIYKNSITTTSSVLNDFKGEIYSDGAKFYITYADYAFSSTNKIYVSADYVPNPRSLGSASTATTQVTTDSSKLLATTEFVQAVTISRLSTGTALVATTASFATTSNYAYSVIGTTSNGYGTRTVSYSSPTGGSDGDIWYQII